MKVIKAYPPNFAELRKAFPAIIGRPQIMFSYGDTLYNPSGKPISPALMVHEETHGYRQRLKGADKWWRAYIASALFRFEEELVAHVNELAKFSDDHGTKEVERYHVALAERLASPMYGNLISKTEAFAKLADIRPPPAPMPRAWNSTLPLYPTNA